MPSEFSKDALANKYILCDEAVHRDDKLLACNLLGLNQSYMRILEHLEKGTAFMKTDGVCLIKITLVEKEHVEIKRYRPSREDVAACAVRRNDVKERVEDLTEKEWLVLKCIGESLAYNNSTLQKVTGLSNDDIRKIIGTLVEKGFVRYAYAKKKGAGKRQKIYFLFSYGEEAYRQKFGEYPDIVRARRKRKDVTHEEMKRKVMEVLGIPDGRFGRFDIIAEDDPIEIETGSNRNDQIYENIKKSVEEFGLARFVVADEVTYNAVLQQVARYRFESRRSFELKIVVYEKFYEKKSDFDSFSF